MTRGGAPTRRTGGELYRITVEGPNRPTPTMERNTTVDPVDAVAILVVGGAAGAVNTAIGAGTLLTFPLLVALGVPALTANVSNTVGLIPAAVTGAWGYRRELSGHWRAVITMATLSVLGGTTGALLLLAAPGSFTTVVPWLLLLAAGLAAAQPRIGEALRRREALAALAAGTTLTESAPAALADAVTRRPGVALGAAVAATGVYGGYFGAAQGVLLLAVLGIAWSADLHRANGAKVVLAGAAQLVSATVFVINGVVDWQIAALIAVGSALGGVVGARAGRAIPAGVLRTLIVVVGVSAAAVLWLR